MTTKSETIAKNARISALRMVNSARSAHIGSSLSVIDILAVIYGDIKKSNDVVIISKGHAAAGVYAVLAHAGVLQENKLFTFGMDGSSLGGHINHTDNEGVRLSTGSLGHGIPYGIGIAIAQKNVGVGGRTIVVISDGECDEGTTWESALFAQ